MTEEYTIKWANSDHLWRKCKLLASLLDTHQDINPNLGGLFRDSFWGGLYDHYDHVNMITGVMAISSYKGLTRNLGIGNTTVWVLPNFWRLGWVRNTKFGRNVSNKMLLNAVKWRRKVFTINAANKLKHLFLKKYATIKVETKLSKFYVTLIFFYNSELWALKTTYRVK